MIDESLRKRLKSLQIKARHLADSPLAGEWTSNVLGQGLEFRDLREYVPGDDIRRLDWKATARTGRAHLRQFRQDRQKTVHLALDLSASMSYGTKAQRARELFTLLGWTAVLHRDRFALVGFTEKLEFHRPPAQGEPQLWAGLQQFFSLEPQSVKTDFGPLWTYWRHTLNHRATCIVISDFAGSWDVNSLRGLCQRHDLWVFHVSDPVEVEGSDGGLVRLRDPENGSQAWADISPQVQKGRQMAWEEARRQELEQEIRRAGGWYAHFPGDQDYFPILMDFLRKRDRIIHA